MNTASLRLSFPTGWSQATSYAVRPTINTFGQWESIRHGPRLGSEDSGISAAKWHHLSKILKVKTFRNEFRKKLRDQVVEWLETDPDERKFASPLSHKQMECLIVRTWEYKQITQGLYRSRSVSSIGRLVPTAEVLSICEAALNASMFDLEPAL